MLGSILPMWEFLSFECPHWKALPLGRATPNLADLTPLPMARKNKKKIGEILVDFGVTTAEKVQTAVQEASRTGKRTGEVLVEQHGVTEVDVARALAEQFGLEFLNLERAEQANRVQRSLIPEDIIRRYLVLPLEKKGNELTLLVHDPLDVEFEQTISFRLGLDRLRMAVASREQIRLVVEGEKSSSKPKGQLLSDSLDKSVDKSVDRSVDRSVDKSIDVDVEESRIVRLCDRIIVEAVNGRASDIHIEPRKDGVMLRYRIDGMCIEREFFPKSLQSSLLARFKLLAGVNISERRVPQDGRIKKIVGESGVDFRVSACPAVHGESIVLRILRPDSARIGLVNLGFEQDNLDVFNKIIRRPNGIFLVTGPTGSGKTTTLYSALDTLNRPDKKIITAEDPVEYAFKGINQVQVRDSIGLTFPAILRSMLRQAPNIILIGEIRDREVADIAIQAALTGHLVFSTLHTNDAPSAITRLIDMGVKPFLVASAIQAVMAQRLVRMLCVKCRTADATPDVKLLRLVGISEEERALGNIQKPVGCPGCDSTGYRGRKAIFELMIMNAELRDLAFGRSSVSKIRNAAIRGGMRSLVFDGKRKILKGDTTPGEVANFAQMDGFDPNEVVGSGTLDD